MAGSTLSGFPFNFIRTGTSSGIPNWFWLRRLFIAQLFSSRSSIDQISRIQTSTRQTLTNQVSSRQAINDQTSVQPTLFTKHIFTFIPLFSFSLDFNWIPNIYVPGKHLHKSYVTFLFSQINKHTGWRDCKGDRERREEKRAQQSKPKRWKRMRNRMWHRRIR